MSDTENNIKILVLVYSYYSWESYFINIQNAIASMI